MAAPKLTAQVKLVTIVAAFDLEPRVLHDLHKLGATGYTVTKANGRGRHGLRTYGIIEPANARIETLASAEVAAKILQHLATAYEGDTLVAFVMDVEAVPRAKFA
jgi:nitrogen regulatory protein PII